MRTTLGRFVLEPLRIYHPFIGVTNKQSECFNATLKRLQGWREVPLDSIVLTLYHLQGFFHNEIQRGFIGKLAINIIICMHHQKEITSTFKYYKLIYKDCCSKWGDGWGRRWEGRQVGLVMHIETPYVCYRCMRDCLL